MSAIDVRTIPPAHRHPLIFSAFDALPEGGHVDLVNDHEPKPLLGQFLQNRPGQFDWQVVEAGPERWQIRITRVKLGPGEANTEGCCGVCTCRGG